MKGKMVFCFAFHRQQTSRIAARQFATDISFCVKEAISKNEKNLNLIYQSNFKMRVISHSVVNCNLKFNVYK
ncbi:hypothetical protein WDV76_15255 [Xenorhabdus griffiniae]|uniref:hypothetical protein n=1 Tax=Xenorhabdus griffiniae TaxID=351672 RepID=UPI0030D0AB64